jgi:hypothetical protein
MNEKYGRCRVLIFETIREVMDGSMTDLRSNWYSRIKIRFVRKTYRSSKSISI